MSATHAIESGSDLPSDTPRSREVVFHELVQIHSGYLFRYAWWRCHDRVLAEDLVQETFLRAWRHLNQLKDTRTAKSWLTTILRREHARLYERARFDIDAETSPDTQAAAVIHDIRPEAFALHQALERLPARYREPLVLQVIGGFTLEEIAGIMEISTSAATTRLFRARRKLRDALSGEGKTGRVQQPCNAP